MESAADFTGDWRAAIMESTSLTDILDNKDPEAEPQPETIGQSRDEQGRFAKDTGEPASAPEIAADPPQDAPPASDTGSIPIAALKDERGKRQDAERRLAELEAEMQRMRTPQAEPDIPDPIEDPKAYHEYVVAEAERRVALRNIQLSAKAAAGRHSDFNEKMQVFQQLAAQNPSLNARLYDEPDPAEWAYRVVKGHEQVNQYGDIDALLQAKRAEWEQEALATVAKPPQSAPTTTATDRSVGARSGPAWSGPASLSDILQT